MEEILIEVQQSYNDYLAKLPNGCQYIAAAFEKLQITEGIQALSNFAEGLEWMTTVNSQLDQLGFPLEMPMMALQSALVEVNDTLKVEDYKAVATLFVSKIQPLITKCNFYRLN